MPTGHEAYVFLAVCCEGHRCGLSAGGELVLPLHFAGLDVNRAEEIVCCGRNEDEPGGCDQGSAVVGGAYLDWQQRWNPERAVGASLAERRVPQGFSSLHNDDGGKSAGPSRCSRQSKCQQGLANLRRQQSCLALLEPRSNQREQCKAIETGLDFPHRGPAEREN